jgi:hypothetical protein
MKKILFTAMLFCALSASAQVPQAVADRLARDYNEEYTLVGIDTIAMPIRIVMSLNFALTLDCNNAAKRLNKILEIADPVNQLPGWLKLEKDIEENLSKMIKIEDIVAMRNSNTRHKDDYYNYQRTTVYLQKSQRKEIFFVKLGEDCVSMTQIEYNELEAETFLMYRNYRDLLKGIKEIIKTY